MLTEAPTATADGSKAPTDTVTITDNRTGKTWELPVQDSCIRAADLRQIKVQPEEFGMMSYDPAFLNTAACRSSVTYLDGERGFLRYRGYPVEDLAESLWSDRLSIRSKRGLRYE